MLVQPQSDGYSKRYFRLNRYRLFLKAYTYNSHEFTYDLKCCHFFQFFSFFSVFYRSTFVGSAWSSGFFFPATTANDLRLRRISIPDFIHFILTILILKREPVFPFFNIECQTRELLVPFYNVFGMTRSLTGDWTRDLPHSMPALYH